MHDASKTEKTALGNSGETRILAYGFGDGLVRAVLLRLFSGSKRRASDYLLLAARGGVLVLVGGGLRVVFLGGVRVAPSIRLQSGGDVILVVLIKR
jgi:hypothetical protein